MSMYEVLMNAGTPSESLAGVEATCAGDAIRQAVIMHMVGPNVETIRAYQVQTENPIDAIIAEYAAVLDNIYENRTAGDHTFHSVLSVFLKIAKEHL